MKNKIGSFLWIILGWTILIGIIYFIEVVVSSIAIILGLLMIAVVFFFLYVITHKWLTTGLNENEKDIAVIMLAAIVYGAIFYTLYYYISPYFDDIESGLQYLLKIIVSTFVLALPFSIVFDKILLLSNKQESKLVLITFITALLSSITLEYFYGYFIMKWLENNWFYLLGGFIVISIIYAYLIIKKNPTSK